MMNIIEEGLRGAAIVANLNRQARLNPQGHIVEPSQDNLEEDDVMFPETEDFDDKADRLYDEHVAKEINKESIYG